MTGSSQLSRSYSALLEKAQELERRIDEDVAIDREEGRRFLGRMVAASWQAWVENGDPDHPCFLPSLSPEQKYFLDNPDTLYLRAPIRCGGGRAYRITGRAPNPTYLGFTIYGRRSRIVSNIRKDAMKFGGDGSFEITISSDRPPGKTNWLPAEDDGQMVQIRHYWNDPSEERVRAEIRYLGDVGPPPVLDAGLVASRIDRAARMLEVVYQRTVVVYGFVSAAKPNEFIVPAGGVDANQLFPTPDNVYRLGWFKLGPGKALRVTGVPPKKVAYWGLQLANAWMESYDYLNHRVSLNGSQIRPRSDGSFEILIADGLEKVPDHPNWIDTAGHREGYMLLRWLCLEGDAETPTIEEVVL